MSPVKTGNDVLETRPERSHGAPSEPSLTSRVISGAMWLFAGTGSQIVFRTIVMMVLSRLLAPEDFGVVSAAAVVTSFVETIAHVGVGPAITQRPKLTEEHVRTAVTFSVALGLFLFLSARYYAPLVAELFGMVELEAVIYAISAVFPLRSLGLVSESLIVRDMHFRLMARIDVLSYVLGYGIVGIVLAFLGYGSWALIYATLAQVAIRSLFLILCRAHPWKPMLNLSALRDLLVFGMGFTLARVGNTLALQGDNFVIGRWLGPVALGIYGRAYQLMVTPASVFGTVLDRVLFPAMASIQDSRERLADSYRRGVALVALFVLPASVVLFVLAPELVWIVLGNEWGSVVAPFRVLVVGTFFRTAYKISDSIARATGAVYRRAWRQWVYAAAVFIGAYVGQRWGVTGVAVGVSVALLVNFFMMAQLSLALTNLGWRQLFAVLVPPLRVALLLSIVVGPISWILRQWLVHGIVTVLVVLALSGGLWLILMIRKPTVFLGNEGVWAVRVLLRAVPEPVRRRLLVIKL